MALRPNHGSWLDMAESELGVLSSPCLSRRIPDKQTLQREVAAWQDRWLLLQTRPLGVAPHLLLSVILSPRNELRSMLSFGLYDRH
jgi:hypothetical protein